METAPGCLPARVGGATRQGENPPRGFKIDVSKANYILMVRVLNILAKPYYRIIYITGIYYREMGLIPLYRKRFGWSPCKRFSANSVNDSA